MRKSFIEEFFKLMVKADRISMQHGLEIRNPFLDYRVVEFAMNLPENKKSVQQLLNLLEPEAVQRKRHAAYQQISPVAPSK